MTERDEPAPRGGGAWNTGTHADFFAYYEKESDSEAARQRFAAIQATLLRLLGRPQRALAVADIGCGAGTQCRLWAQHGHQVHGADINAALVELGRQRAAQAGLAIDFAVASATALPWPDQSMDLCIAPELLEHVADWQGVLAELVRVLKPGGALFLSTSNRLCPRQQEFTLPMYSWYPGFVKRRVVALALSTRPELAGYAVYPAVHWFTFYGLRDHLAARGVVSLDRFDMMDVSGRGVLVRAALRLIRALPPLRLLAHVATSYTVLLGVKESCGGNTAHAGGASHTPEA
ncbi:MULTISPECIES: class I SAM-dependent methyltransferase [unclassified Janthinobacterium]|uniref:class I SAM-dependent methyltransferase n=1 Tax=unclassified Janthinobacterium TaxID=2610881 RepID=UPI0003455A35|nr:MULTISPECIES: class I SAM-dependent methyltransferase [unclassified Janthinobacterium]MEC5161287.1 SAM-dependent methyltransferase [Janthinobacterium sp. CG_S6]